MLESLPNSVNEILKMIDERFGRGVGTAVLATILLGIVAVCLQAAFSLISPLAQFLGNAIPALRSGKPLVPSELWATTLVTTTSAVFVCAVSYIITRWTIRQGRRDVQNSYDAINDAIASTKRTQEDFEKLTTKYVAEVRQVLDQVQHEKEVIREMIKVRTGS